MKLFFLFIVLFAPHLSFTQKKELKKRVNELETFVNAHIPSGASNVEGFKLKADHCFLDKETMIKGDQEEHHKVYNLENATFTVEYFKVSDASGDSSIIHSEYWSVVINDKAFLSGFTSPEEAEKLIVLLKKVQETCAYE